MKRQVIALTAVALMGGAALGNAEVSRTPEDCAEYCARKAVEKCDDVTSTWCNAYIVGCLAGCGVSHL